ncbi:MAG: transcriptional regulator [Desulfurococcales archaeon ex4484_217_2]|nr:MAG: transcriptional regulator [Desulfurococcales archaeon ex4484_217_2]
MEVRLREFRARYRVSQEELARSVGVTRQTIIAIEKGKYLPSLTLALKIARFFNVPVEEIFKLKEKCYPRGRATEQ